MKKITFLFMLLAVTLGYGQSPTDNATAPPARDAGDVISIFSGEYTDVAGSDFNPNWGQSGFGTANAAFDPGTGDLVVAYPNINYQGVQFGSPQPIAAMEFLHVDIWIEGTFNPNVFVISSGAEIGHPITNTGAQSWISVDIPVAGITGDLSNAIQFKFDGGNGSTDAIYVDNLYFWKSPSNPATDATLSDLQVDSATIAGFSSATTDYTVELPNGTTVVPQITMATTTNMSASANITQASGIPGSATVVVTAADMSTTETYTVSFIITGPATAAPTPIARNAWDVISLFSNAYTDITVSEWSTSWDSASIEDVLVDGNDTKKITYGDFLGIDFSANSFDATEMERFHIDYFVDEAVTGGEVFIPKWSNHTGGTGETNALLYTATVTASGTWVSIDIPFSDFTGQITPPNGTDGNARDNFSQLILGTGATMVNLYVDNIYLYRAPTVLSTNEFELSEVKIYPNPTNGDWNISGNSVINNIAVYDILGKQVVSLTPNANEAVIDASSLNSGIYFAKIEGNNGSKTVKLIKQ